MTGSDFNTLVRLYTNTDTAVFTAAQLALIANRVKDEIALKIKVVRENYFVMISTRDLEDGIREYSWPTEMMGSMKQIEAKLDGTNWVTLSPLDVNTYGQPTDETTILNTFSNEAGHCFYLNQRRSFFIYSGAITAVDEGIKLHHVQWPADIVTATFSDTTTDLSTDPSSTTFGIPKEFHELWARQVAIIWKSTRPKPLELSPFELKFDLDLKLALSAITPVEDNEQLQAFLPDDSDKQM